MLVVEPAGVEWPERETTRDEGALARRIFKESNALCYAAIESYNCERSAHTLDRLSASACVRQLIRER